jgi:peptide/nickel transport system ATP-binding protein
MVQQSEILLEIKHLKKYFPVQRGILDPRPAYQVRAVDNVSFHIGKGETLGLVGESGSGKTTVGRTILRAMEPTEGEILFCMPSGKFVDVAKLDKNTLKAFRQHAQMIFQDPYSSLTPQMTVRDIIGEPLIVNNYGNREVMDERVREVARLCGLKVEHLRRYPHAFSGGQRQRIGIARALVLNPSLVVCDEPVSALDVSIQAQILNLLQKLQQELDLTYLFIAHDLSVIEHISDRVAVMYLGNIVELAATDRLFYNPLHPYTEALMSAIPLADPHVTMKPMVLEGEIPDPSNPPSGCPFHPRCNYAKEICEEKEPEWTEYHPGHFASCHFVTELRLTGAKGEKNA